MARVNSPTKRWKIGEVAEATGIPKATLNHWTTLRLLRVVGRSSGGHRLYDEEVFERVEIIKKGQEDGKSLAEIGKEQGWD